MQIDRYTDELLDLLDSLPNPRRDPNDLRRFIASVWVAGAVHELRPYQRARVQDVLIKAIEFVLTESDRPLARTLLQEIRAAKKLIDGT